MMAYRLSAFRLAAAMAVLLACAPFAAQAQEPPPPPATYPAATPPAPLPKLMYTRIKPCRVFDTTKSKKIPANSAKSFIIAGEGDYAAQGGLLGGCGIPVSAQAVSVNLTAINGAAAGSLTAMPYAETVSSATIRYPVTAPETVSGIVDLAQNKITLRTTNTVNAIGDVTGYWEAPIWLTVYSGTGKILRGSPHALSTSKPAPYVIVIHFDRDMQYCSPVASAKSTEFKIGLYGADNGNNLYVYFIAPDQYTVTDFNIHIFC